MPRSCLVLDLETTRPAKPPKLAISDAELNKGIASNWGPEARQRHRAKNRKEFEEGLAERASLDYRLGELAAVGFAKFDGLPRVALCFRLDKREQPNLEEHIAQIGADANAEITLRWRGSETGLLSWAWEVIGGPAHKVEPLVGFGLWDFDLPWLLGRSAIVGTEPSRHFPLHKRYPDDAVVDWADRLSFHGAFSRDGWTLARYADLFDLKPKPFGEGSEFPDRFARGDYGWCIRHLVHDLVCTLDLDRRFAPGLGA